MSFKKLFFLTLILFLTSSLIAQNDRPNILLVISDDLGVDYTNGYHQGGLRPTTPTLDSLMATGITFDNVFSTPVCAPTRAAIMSGKYGVHTGVLSVPGNLDTSHTSIFKALENQTSGAYADALIGKWHLSNPEDPQHPAKHGVDYYMGVLRGAVNDYFSWSKTENGQTTESTDYVTSVFTDASIDWINAQSQPWFLWLAHVAPHTPLHTPPSDLYTIANPTNNNRRYIAMIESVDHEIGRLLSNMSPEERANTVVIYVGDNGTPNSRLRDYPDGHGKGSLYQGGIRVPMIIAGAGITRQGERESALIHVADIHATILELAGAELPGGIYNSLSFEHLLKNEEGATRDYNFSEVENDGNYSYTIRNHQYKLIDFVSDGTQEFYDLLNDSLETTNLLNGTLTEAQVNIKMDLEVEAQQIRAGWSCRDHIQNGDEEGIDCGGSSCSPCTTTHIEVLPSNAITIYPNPVLDVLNISSTSNMIEEIQVFDSFGKQLISKEQIHSSHTQLHIQQLPPQILWIRVMSQDGLWMGKVLVGRN